ncbi:MAG: DUF5063 domain-containing protein [Bacteroidota bacterium]
MDFTENDPVLTRQVVEFITVSNEFCLFTEKVETYPKDDFVEYYRRILPLLYLKGSLLKTVETDGNDASERFVTQEEWEHLFNTIRNKLYPDDHFWVSTDMYDENTEIEKASIAECIADIYQDMKDFLMLYQKSRHAAKVSALNDVCRHFENHWGPAAIKSMYALHNLNLKLR